MTEALVLIQGRSKEPLSVMTLNTLSIFSVEVRPGGKLKVQTDPKHSYFA